MTTAPASIQALMAVWESNDGTNLGIVGDAAHAARSSYHNGWDVASKLAGSTVMATVAAGDYSYKLARDKVKSNAASAMDLGRLHGSLGNLQKFSVWLVNQCKANPTKYNDVREVIYSPDGTAIRRWDNELKALRTGGDGTGQGDNSHRTHTHISFYRDSEARDKRALFVDYFAPPTPLPDSSASPSTEADMRAFVPLPTPEGIVHVKGPGHAVFSLEQPTTYNQVPDNAPFAICGKGRLVDDINAGPGDRKTFFLVDGGGKAMCLLADTATFTPAPAADCSGAVDAAVRATKASAKVVFG